MNVTNTNIHDYTDYGVQIQNHQILINLDTNFNIEVYLLLIISTGIIYNASNIPPEYQIINLGSLNNVGTDLLNSLKSQTNDYNLTIPDIIQ